ncbi:MAG: hypothetical protein R6U98_06555 [Pirellulaceae bacterium]
MRMTGAATTSFDEVFGAPFRVAGGAAKSAQEQLKEAVRQHNRWWAEPEGKKELPGMGERVWKSLTYEDPVYMGDVMEEAGKSIAGRDLTSGERTAAHLFGLFAELAAPGGAVKALRLGKGAPMPRALARQAEKTLKSKGIEVAGKKPVGKTFWTGAAKAKPEKPLAAEARAVSRHELQRLGERAAEALSHPERIRIYLDEVKAIGKNLGLSPEMIDGLEREAIRRMGREGARFGKSGVKLARPMSKEAAKTTQLAEAERIKQAGKQWIPGAETMKPSGVEPRLVPIGGERTGTARIPGVGELFWGGETAQGAKEAVRPASFYRSQAAEEAMAEGRAIEKAIGSEERSVRLTRLRDMEYNFRQRDRLAVKAQEATDPVERSALMRELAERDNELTVSMRRTGLTEPEIRTGYIAKDANEQRIVKEMETSVDEMRRVELGQDIPVGMVDQDTYVARNASREYRELMREVSGGRRAKAVKKAEGFAKKRQKYLSTSTAGTRNIDFIERMGEWYAARKQAHALAVSNRMAERAILKGYGNEITNKMARSRGLRDVDELIKNKDFMRDLRAKGLEIYSPQVGEAAPVILDKGTAKFLNRVIGEREKWFKAWQRYNNWWKARATVMRPGFVVRNVLGGNLWQMWEAGVPIMDSVGLGVKAMRHLSKTQKGQFGTVVKTMLHQLDEPGKVAKIGKYTFDEAIREGLRHGVPGGGFFGSELGMTGRGGTVGQAFNPMSSKFVLMRLNARLNRMGEDMARWGIFLGKLKKGYTPREASASVAKYLFNYNELAKFGSLSRQVVPFSTWNLKNWGMQLSVMLNKPDKFSRFTRLWNGIQGLDPLPPEDAEDIPDWAKPMQPFFIPGKRGPEEGARQWTLGAGIMPISSIDQIRPSEIPATIGQMLHPVFRMAVDLVGAEAEKDLPPYWGTHPRKTAATSWVPTWIRGAMDYAKDSAPGVYSAIVDSGFIEPAVDHITGMPMGYKWDREIEDMIQTIDPGLATVNRVFRHSDERMYNTLLAQIIGAKLYEFTEEKRQRYREEKIREAERKAKDLRKRGEQLGILPSDYSPFRNVNVKE